MMLRILLALSLLSACGDDDDSPGDGSYDLVVDTFNVGLAGAFVPNEEARREAMVEGLDALEGDVVCLQEVWEQSDKELIEAGLAEAYPHVVTFTHDLDTPIDDPVDQNGNTPPAPTTPPCESFGDELEAAVSCLSEMCSTDPGNENAQTTSSDCAEAMCLDAVTTLVLGSAESLRCYACLATSLPTESFADMRELCTTEVNADVAFRGQSGLMILSKHPLSDAQAHVLPGTWNRRVIASATATLPNDVEVDVHCNHLTPVFDSVAFPYTGGYSNDLVGADAWAAEQTLQAQKLVAYVEDTSEGRAVVLGDFNAGRAVNGLDAEAVATMDVLEDSFELAVPSDYTPVCTFCPEENQNFVEESGSVWIDHIFLYGIDASAVQSAQRTFSEATVDADGTMVPLSDHYGLRSTIRVTP